MGITAANVRIQRRTKAFGEELNSDTAETALHSDRLWRKQGHEHAPQQILRPQLSRGEKPGKPIDVDHPGNAVVETLTLSLGARETSRV